MASMRLGQWSVGMSANHPNIAKRGKGYMIFQPASTILRDELLDNLKLAKTLRHDSLSHVFLRALGCLSGRIGLRLSPK